ncbi:25456_t:CDS:2, partial [Racocetra persica]
MRAKLEEITSWYQYRKYFKKRLDDILPENQRNDKRANDLASGQIYDEMLQYLSAQLEKIKLSELNLTSHTHTTEPVSTDSISKTEACEKAKKTLPETKVSEETKKNFIENHANQTNAE